MRLERILGGLILWDLVLWIATIVTEKVSVPFLPEPLRAYAAASGPGDRILYVVLTGPTVMSPLGSLLDAAMTMAGGTILGLVYFSELRLRFRTLSDLRR